MAFSIILAGRILCMHRCAPLDDVVPSSVRPLGLESGPGPGWSGYTHRSRCPAVAGHRCEGGVAGVIGEREERTG
jgi:hypothetical protein